MSTWLVMSREGRRDADSMAEAVLVRDGFSVVAFIFPSLWFLWHRSWAAALIWFAAGAGVTLMAMDVWLAPLALALNVALATVAALEGGNILRFERELRGFAVIDLLPDVTREEAELLLPRLVRHAPASGRPSAPPLRAPASHASRQPSATADRMIFPGH